MNKFGLALVLLALVAAPYSYALELFSMDCKGGISVLPSYPIGIQFDMSAYLGVADTFLAAYKDRLKCLCGDLTDDEFNRLFHPFFGADMAFNIIQGQSADLSLSRCPWSAFDGVWMRADNFDSYKVDLTSTCSYQTWKNDGKCFLQSQSFSDWDVTIKAGLFKCPQAPWRPAFSVICEGKGCQQAFIPCTSNSDCAGDMTCQEFVFDNVARPNADDMLSAFKSILRASDLTSSCVNTGDIISKAVDLVRKMWKQGSATYTSPQVKVCSPIQLNFQTNNGSFDWESFVHYTPNVSISTTGNTIGIGYLQSWTGGLITGGQMTAPQNVASKPTNVPSLTPGGTLIMQKSCDGTFSMLPGAGFGISFGFGDVRSMIDLWVSTVSSILKCRFGNLGVTISDQAMKERWGLGLDWVFANVDADRSDSNSDSLLDFRLGLSSRIKLPSTCNYDSWVKEGVCRAQYTGLSDLLGVDVTANVEVKRCGSSSDVSVAVECAGAACSLLSLKTKTCNADSDCPNSLTCQDLNPKFGDYDWMNAYVGINATKHPSCSRSQDARNAEIRKLALSFLGIPYDGSSSNKYCMIDYDHVVSQGSTWAKGEIDTDSTPGVVTLKNLKAWDGAASGNTPTSSSVTLSFNFVLSALGFAMVVMFS